MQNAKVWCKSLPHTLALGPHPWRLQNLWVVARIKTMSLERPTEGVLERGFFFLVLQLLGAGRHLNSGPWRDPWKCMDESLCPAAGFFIGESVYAWALTIPRSFRQGARCKGDGEGVDEAMLNPRCWISGCFWSTSTCKDSASHLGGSLVVCWERKHLSVSPCLRRLKTSLYPPCWV